ncbi:MAG: hypothetical protein J6S38_05155 [Erysipelotrichaceae bacterium]|nr:hypothetical protein [Erysipelotrichaceae bacterium]
MSKKKNKKISEPEKNYYKLNTAAVDRLATVNKENARKVSDEEIKKYNSSILNRIPVWVKALFIKFWFAGAVCFFFYWGLAMYLADFLDQMFVFGLGLGIVTDLLTSNVLKFISSEDKEYYPYIMFPSGKYWTLIANVAYAFLLLFLTYKVYGIFKLNVEPILFGIIYTAIDMLFITIKNLIVAKIEAGRA